MGSASRYWQLVRLGGTRKRRVEEVAIAKDFFQQRFPDLILQPDVPDTLIQRDLFQQWQQNNSASDRAKAELCLRCFISHHIEQACVRLEKQFGATGGFTRHDLLPFVLDDDGQMETQRRSPVQYQTMASHILQTFDPNRASLSTWTWLQIRQHPKLNTFLRQYGIDRISDWALLNNTRPEQLPKLLSEFHGLTQAQIEQSCFLLQVYHEIYRHDRWQQCQSSALRGSGCTSPTTDQLVRMANRLHELTNLTRSNESILSLLQTLATQLRQYRYYLRTGEGVMLQSLDQPGMQERVAEIAAPETDVVSEQEEFLSFYRTELAKCLVEAIAQATKQRVAYLQRKRAGKKATDAEKFLQALHLFHCQGKSMGEIALQIGLKAQFQVTRLMKLKEFRTSVRQQLLQLLCDRVLEKAKIYADPACLHNLNHTLEVALDEQVSTLMQQANAEAAVAKQRPLTSLFAQQLCSYLDARRIAL